MLPADETLSEQAFIAADVSRALLLAAAGAAVAAFAFRMPAQTEIVSWSCPTFSVTSR